MTVIVLVIFLSILIGVPALTAAWWWWAHRRWSELGPGRGRRAGQLAIGGFAGAFLVLFAAVVIARFSGVVWLPNPWLTAAMMIWAILILPLLVVPMLGGWGAWRLGQWLGRTFGHAFGRGRPEPEAADAPDADTPADEAAISRRRLLGAGLSTLPMVLTLGTAAYSIPQKRRFRIRHLTVDVPGLPEALDGMRIAHLSDAHVGKFTRGEVLRRLAEATNRLEADLVLMTGDLLDQTVDDLPEALSMIDRIDRRSGLVTIEGNHDLFDGRDAFAQGVRSHGVPLLLDQSTTVTVRGRPVQILGTMWHMRGNPIAPHVDRTVAQRDPDAFPILLGHHPHVFDRAAEHGLPLTLAGHTHGGQLMLNEALGAGPAIYKYWSGLYRHGASRLVVSNGMGNWFPLRTAAPAEIIHLTLRPRPRKKTPIARTR